MTKRCKTPSPHLDPKYKRVDAKFEVQSQKESELEQMLAKMKGTGMNAKVYSPDDVADIADGMDLDDYEDEDGGYDGAAAGMGGFGGSEEGFDSDKPFAKAGSNYEF